MREGNKLSAAAVRNAKEPGLYGDGHGLYLQVSAFKTKAWVFRYMIDGVARKMGLGAIHTISLAEARAAALEARKLSPQGGRPYRGRDGHASSKEARGRQGDHVQAMRRQVH